MTDQIDGQGAARPPPVLPNIVAVGASAGGLDALKEFFGAVQSGGDFAYVVVTHMQRDHVSHMAELLSRAGGLDASEAVDGETVRGNRIYVIPPGAALGIQGGKLLVTPVATRPTAPKPIDFFMDALAEDAGARGAGIVLSGTDHDGSIGLRAIKAAGGLTLVQTPATAQYPGMPDSAIETGAVDLVLEPRHMPAALREYFQVALKVAQNEDEAGTSGDSAVGLNKILTAVLRRTGHDFRWYRPGMLRRRLRRRMALHRIVAIDEYVDMLEQSREEVEALKDEFLIGVTSFFRDQEAWRQLADEVIPALIAGWQPGDAPIRVWTPGCATGEETYSVAMLLLEQMDGSEDAQPVQVFGTDIDLDSLAIARAGSYPASIASDVSADRLLRFFERRGDRYVVRKTLRDAVMFAPQDLVRDTPFSRLDMVICRNLLIYFEPALQARVLELFHFALKSRGLLVLGKAEWVGTHSGMFEVVSTQKRVFRRVGGRAHLPRDFIGNDTLAIGRRGLARRSAEPRASNADRLRAFLGDREVTAAVLVDREGRALYFHGRIGQFLEPQGEAALDVVTLVRPEFRAALRRLLRQAATEGHAIRRQALVGAGGDVRQVSVEADVISVAPHDGLIAVLFNLAGGDVGEGRAVSQPAPDQLPTEREMEDNRRELALALEEAERSNDDLRAASEESLALNEELQSSNEELESSKEELQSLNEELATVNAQLEDKIAEVARSHDDLANLLSSTHIATILLDQDLKIRKFTPSARALFTLQPGDEGRLLSDISARTEDARFASDVAQVLRTSDPMEMQIRASDGRALLRRVLPYRGADASSHGVVVTYIDISLLQKAAEQARHLTTALQDSNDAVVTYNLDGSIAAWNEGARKAYGYDKARDEGSSLFAHIPAEHLSDARSFLRDVVERRSVGPQPAERLASDGKTMKVSVTATTLCDDLGKPYAILATERDITEELERATEARFRRLADDIPALLRVDDIAGRTELVNRAFAEFVGRERQTLLGNGWLELIEPTDREAYLAATTHALSNRTEAELDFRLRRSDGVYRWMRTISVPHLDAQGEYTGFVALTIDVEERKRAETALLEADHRKDEYVAMLAHELRNPLAPIRNAVSVLAALPGLDAKAQWATSVIGRQTGAMARLLDDLLDVSRLGQGKVTLAVAPMDVNVLIERAVEISRPLIDSKGHELAVVLPTKPIMIEGDLMRLAQVLSNLLNNAAKYTDRGGRIELSAERNGGSVDLRVRDNGAGITSDMLQRVFDLFAQADRTLDRAYGGLGLGLTLARQLVDLHHGTITARSAGIGKGSEFLVTLPALPDPAESPKSPLDASRRANAASRKIVVVDDNVDAAESLAIMLRMLGHEVRVAIDGPSCMAVAEEFSADAFVLDIGLPGWSGYEVARRLRSRSASAQATLIALTGYGQPEDARQALEAGFDHHVIKPVAPERIEECIAGGRT